MHMEYPGNLFVVAAPSGAGKSSLVKALLELDAKLAVSISHTSRAPRGQEQHGREYWFVSPDEFRAMAQRGDFFEWAEVHGNLYGTSRAAIEARVLVTDRMTPLRVADRVVHHVGLPYHWGRNGLSTGDPANELSSVVLDPNSHIQEVKAFTVDIQPGRRPRGAAVNALVESYQRRAGVTDKTGTEV